MRSLLAAVWPVSCAAAQTGLDFLNYNRPTLHALNCYPVERQWADRIGPGLGTGFSVVIEQDTAWANRAAGALPLGQNHRIQPPLRDYFFERVRPIVEDALKRTERALHLDFKDRREPLLRAVWNLLGDYENWITTAAEIPDPPELARRLPVPVPRVGLRHPVDFCVP